MFDFQKAMYLLHKYIVVEQFTEFLPPDIVLSNGLNVKHRQTFTAKYAEKFQFAQQCNLAKNVRNTKELSLKLYLSNPMSWTLDNSNHDISFWLQLVTLLTGSNLLKKFPPPSPNKMDMNNRQLTCKWSKKIMTWAGNDSLRGISHEFPGFFCQNLPNLVRWKSYLCPVSWIHSKRFKWILNFNTKIWNLIFSQILWDSIFWRFYLYSVTPWINRTYKHATNQI